MREAPSRTLMEALWDGGRTRAGLRPGGDGGGAARSTAIAQTSRSAAPRRRRCDGADALAIVTEWQEFRSPDFDLIRERLRSAGDLRRPQPLRPGPLGRLGFGYYAIGRGSA